MEIAVKYEDMCRFWNFVSVDPKTGCWLWDGHLQSDRGNGQRLPAFSLRDQKIGARRFSYLAHFGTLPPMVYVDCDNPLCVCPRHMTPRPTKGQTTGKVYRTRENQRLSEKTVRQVITLRRLGYSQPAIARKTGVGQGTVCIILKMARLCRENKLKPFRTKKKGVNT